MCKRRDHAVSTSRIVHDAMCGGENVHDRMMYATPLSKDGANWPKAACMFPISTPAHMQHMHARHTRRSASMLSVPPSAANGGNASSDCVSMQNPPSAVVSVRPRDKIRTTRLTSLVWSHIQYFASMDIDLMSCGTCESSSIVTAGLNGDDRCVVLANEGGGYACVRGTSRVSLQFSNPVSSVRVVSEAWRELVGGLGSTGLELASSFTGEVIAVLKDVKCESYSVGTRYVVWQTPRGIVSCDLLDERGRVRLVHKCTSKCSFCVISGDVLAYVDEQEPSIVVKMCLNDSYKLVPKLQRVGCLNLSNRHVGPISEHCGHLYYARNTERGVAIQQHALATNAVTQHVVPSEPRWIVADVSKSVVASASRHVICLRYNVDTLGNKRVGRCVVVDGDSASIQTCSDNALLIVSASMRTISLHDGPAAAAILWSADTCKAPSKIVDCGHTIDRAPKIRTCQRCRVKTPEFNMGVKYCIACAQVGTCRQLFGVALQYARCKFKFAFTHNDSNILRRRLWKTRPTCWMTGATSSRKSVLVFAPIDDTKPMSMSNVCILKRANVAAERSSVQQARLFAMLARFTS